jgi:tripartite motif-containing protein 71
MRVALRSLLVCVLSVVLAGLSLEACALAAESLGGDASPNAALSGSPLVVPDAGWLFGVGQQEATQAARRASPKAFAERLASRTEFAHLGVAGAARVAREAFPALIEKHDGGVPTLLAGEKLRRFSAENVAQISLPDHERGVVESVEPMATRSASGQFQPINLALKDEGASITPIASQVAVQIPKHLGGGVRAPQSGVSLTPIDGKGQALHGSEGSVDGASVLYANTQTDTDTLAKPTSRGFELSAILRSEASPHELDYRLGLPSGASLVWHRQHSPVQVVKEGVTIGMVLPPTAVDAAGTPVPVTMTVAGDLLTVNVQDASGEYQYPLRVDPEYATGRDRSLTGGVWPVEHPKEGETNWVPIHSAGFSEEHTYKKQYGLGGNPEWYEQAWYIEPEREYNGGEFAGLRYRTQGNSTIYNLEMWLYGEDEPSQTKTEVEYRYGPNEEGEDNHVLLTRHEGKEKLHELEYEPLSITSGYLNNPLETPRENDVRLMDYTTQHESSFGFWTWIWDAQVYVAQEESKHPEVESTSACPSCGFNKSSPTIAEAGGRTNVLYGSGTWLSPYQGAFEATAHDPGIGVSFAGFTGTVGYHPRWIRNELHRCLGIQCPETFSDWMTYNSSMPNGEDEVEFFAEDAAGLFDDTYAYPRIKVDASKPYNLGFTGMPEVGAEISAAQHKLTVHATDGKKPTPSSGVRSISVSIDGGTPTELSGASCPEGECTVSSEYTLDAESLSEGVHRLVVSAVSNSSESEAREFLFDVRHASPVSVGPGSVDPTTGQLTLTASDVSLGGASGVSRSYQSRNLTSGASGPLGPQWAMSVGGGEDLIVLPTGSVSVVSDNGGRTTFSLNSKSEFESPKGDENLKVEYKSAEHKYVLKDEKAGAETIFEQPKGTEDTSPQDVNQFGAESAVLDRPVSDAIDSSGDIWVTDWVNNRIVKFSPTGAVLAAYGTYGYEAGEMIRPWGIAINQKTGNVYVTDYGNNRIDEFSPSGSFIKAMGWGVSNGAAEYETCTSVCQAGIAGSGNGQFNALEGVSVDTSGNIWAVDYGNARIEEFNEAGEYELKFGSAGAGAGQLNAPMDIAFAGGNMYVTDESNNRIDEFSTAGSFIKTIGWGVSNGKEELETCTSSCQAGIAGSGNGQFSLPRGLTTDPASGNLYVTEIGGDRVQEITTSGAFVTKFGSGGSGLGQFAQPMGIVVSSSEEIYITDFENARVQVWGRQTWWPTSAKGSLSKSTTYLYQSVTGNEGTSIDPSEVLSPAPEGVSCGTKTEELKEEKDKGCHALTFKYATGTTAKGESEGEWGEYDGRLSQVMFHAWNPSSKTMEEKAVAQYSYDKQGRLRAEWDPRMESSTACGKTCSALKRTYGYDTEGHVTALTPPGRETWALVYGTLAGDSNTSRLLKVTHAPASASLWNGELSKNTEAPKLSGTPAVAVRMAVSNGVWSNSPIIYSYQWEDCNSEGKSCTPILGATNANYTPVSGDVGHTLVAQIAAINGGGSVIASSAASAVVSSEAGAYTQTVDGGGNSLKAVSCVPATTDCITSDSSGKVFYATNVSSSSASSWTGWTGPGTSPSEAVDCATSSLCLLAAGSEGSGGNLYYATSLGGSWTEAYAPAYGVDAISCASSSFCVDGQDGDGYFRYATSPASTSWTLESQGTAAMKGVSCLSISFCAIADSKGDIHVANSTSQIESSLWKETDVDGTTALNGVACTSTSSCVAIDGVGDVLNLTIESSGAASAAKHDIDGSNDLTSVSCASSTCVAVDSVGNVFVSENKGETWTKQYSLGDDLTSVSCASTSLCATVDTAGKFTALSPSGKAPEGEARSPQPGSTIEYRVPVSGTGLPTLTKEEVEKWGQKDNNEYEDNDPVEGTAVFPPDETQGWPASKYTRATIDYINSKGLTVNTASPTGGVSTAEYNELNEAVRTLDADNRAAAMKEGCISVSKKECKSAEVSEKLATQTEYSPNGSDIVKVLGPEHKIKLASGEEVEARAVSHDYYDEDAREVEEKNHETYNLLTKSTSGALLASGEEKEVRTSITSYSGQKDLGWKLRKPTSVATDPAGLDLVHTTLYNEASGDVVETKAPGGTSETVYPPTYSTGFGSEGIGKGQFKQPMGVALDSTGNVWVDDKENGRIEKFSSAGSFLAEYGAKGSGNDQFSGALGIAIAQSTGYVYVADTNNNRMEELNNAGEFIRTFGTEGAGDLAKPVCVTVDSSGDVWVSDNGHNRIVEFSATGVFMREVSGYGTGNGQLNGPEGITISEGSLFVVDSGNDRVEQFSVSGAYLGQFGSNGSGTGQFKEPVGIAANPTSGDLYVSDYGNKRIEEFSPAGKFLSAWAVWGATHELDSPTGVTIGATGVLYIADEWTAKVSEWLPPEAGGANLRYASQFGSDGSGNGQFYWADGSAIDGHGNVWVTDQASDRVQEFSSTGAFIATYGKEGSGEVQFKEPVGIDVNQSTGDVYVADAANNRIEELSSSGAFIGAFGTSGSGQLNYPEGIKIDSSGNVWVADTNNDRIVEFSSTGAYIAAYGSKGSGEVQFNRPLAIAFSGPNLYVTDYGNDRIEELSYEGKYIRKFGTEGSGSGEFYGPEGIAADSAGNLYVVDEGNGRVEEFSAAGAFRAIFASKGHSEGQLTSPTSISINAAGDMYVADSGDDRIEEWIPANQAAHDTQTIYYSAETNATYPNCGKHPEWANLPCQAQLAAQPDRGLPELPVTSMTYNIWGEVETSTERFGMGVGAVNREKIQTYDAAGRAVTSEEKSTPATDTALPKVTNEYNAETGALEKQSATIAEKTKTITAKDNKLGQPVEYTDAEGNVAKYSYEEGSDGRLEEVSEGKGKEAESKQTYSYDPTTGFMTKLIDSAAGTFTASYDLEGKMASEIYPNGMCANTSYNPVGTATSIEYVKTRNCSETGATVWFSDSVAPSIHGETLAQTSTLAKESYAYDSAGRLIETQETPAGKGCVTRLYGYEEESNRTSLTTREPGTEGKCASEGGTVQRHTYDEANRLTDENVVYETFGNITKMPAADAGEHEITSTYYLDNQLASETQNGETFKYLYDPAGRTMETTSEGKTSSKAISHYAGPGNALTWTSEGSEKWTRNIPGIDGALDAVQTSTGSTVLQLHDLQGNIVGTVGDSESETKLLSTYNSTEFGVPQPGTTPPKYAWLGAAGVSTETSLGSGVATQSGASYVPQVARALQTAPVIPPGAFPDGSSGTQFTAAPVTAAAIAAAQEIATQFWQKAEAERQKAKEEEAAATLRQCQEEGGCGVGIDPKCTLQLSVGDTISSTGKEWVYARAWATCRGVNLPEGSVLEVCLEESNPWSPVSPAPRCDKVVAGEGAFTKPGDSLYAHEHVKCGSETTYRGAAGFLMPGMTKPLTVIDIEGGCGLGGAEGLISMAASFIELFPGIFDYGG